MTNQEKGERGVAEIKAAVIDQRATLDTLRKAAWVYQKDTDYNSDNERALARMATALDSAHETLTHCLRILAMKDTE